MRHLDPRRCSPGVAGVSRRLRSLTGAALRATALTPRRMALSPLPKASRLVLGLLPAGARAGSGGDAIVSALGLFLILA